MSLADVKSLEDYILKYGPLLSGRAVEDFDPIHVPGRDSPLPAPGVGRPLFPAQQHYASALAKTLRRQRAVLMIGELGVGKTSVALAIPQMHAAGRPYRALVMAPDHLVKKWVREARAVIPGCVATAFSSWRDVLALEGLRDGEGGWEPPRCPEWYVLGRDQAKGDPGWEARPAEVVRWVKGMGTVDVLTGKSTPAWRPSRRAACPGCGAEVLDRDDNPLGPAAVRALKRKPTCKECGTPLWQFVVRPTKAEADRLARARLRAGGGGPADGFPCRSRPAADRGAAPRRWAPDMIVQRQLGRLFDYFVLDEAHEEKSASSAQANAAGKIAASCRKTIALTGTLFGGYAWHCFNLLWRLNPTSVREAGFEWRGETAWNECYGRVEEVVRTTTTAPTRGASNALSRGETRTERRKTVKPGIMPTLFGDHLIGTAAFLSLEEIADALPPRPADELFAVPMDGDVAAAYRRIEGAIRDVIAPMIRLGDTSLLSRMLYALLDYPDMPYGWNESGYLHPFGLYEVPEFDPARVYPKEAALIADCKREAAAGRQVWVYCMQTGVRDVTRRLARLMGEEGLAVGVLDRSVPRDAREDWIRERARGLDVAISHPKLVETGMELFNMDAGVNFPTILWYETGYNTFTVRQAGRRSWRIGQTAPCRLGYYFYVDPSGHPTMQGRAIDLVGRKLAAAEAMDGRFSSEGLAALVAGDNPERELARQLAERIDEPTGRAWERVHTARVVAVMPHAAEPDPEPDPEARLDASRAGGGAPAAAAWETADPGPETQGAPLPAAEAIPELFRGVIRPAARRAGGRKRAEVPGQLNLF